MTVSTKRLLEIVEELKLQSIRLQSELATIRDGLSYLQGQLTDKLIDEQEKKK